MPKTTKKIRIQEQLVMNMDFINSLKNKSSINFLSEMSTLRKIAEDNLTRFLSNNAKEFGLDSTFYEDEYEMRDLIITRMINNLLFYLNKGTSHINGDLKFKNICESCESLEKYCECIICDLCEEVCLNIDNHKCKEKLENATTSTKKN